MNELKVIQTAVIDYSLVNAKIKESKERVEKLLSVIDVNDDSQIKEIKDIRATLNNEFKEFETARKEIKKAVNEPYEQFNNVYKELELVYKTADLELKTAVESIEGAVKSKIKELCTVYFNKNKGEELEWLTFDRFGMNIVITGSLNKNGELTSALINTIDGAIKSIKDAIDLIQYQPKEQQEDILEAFKETLDINQSIARTAALYEKAAQIAAAKTPSETEQKPRTETEPKGVVITKSVDLTGDANKLKILEDYARQLGIKWVEQYDF